MTSAPDTTTAARHRQPGLPVPTADARIVDVRLGSYAVTWRTWWDVVELESDDGAVGLGEWSDAGTAESAVPIMQGLARGLVGKPASEALAEVARLAAQTAEGPLRGSRHARLTALGGLDAALCDLQARRAGAPLWDHAPTNRVVCYANINRAIRHRVPSEFARVARDAVDAGFRTLKCAPFDFLAGTRRIRTGLDLARAVRDAVGDDIDVLLDLHGHLSVRDLLTVSSELAALRPGWVEDAAGLDDVAGLRAVREATGCRLAGGEMAASLDELAPALDAGVLDVVMPDIKHAGGPRRALRLAAGAAAAGVEVSLHNPTGPVSSAHSAALAAVCPASRVLELAVLEDPARARLVIPAEQLTAGALVIPADRIGVGVVLADATVRPCSWSWSATADG